MEKFLAQFTDLVSNESRVQLYAEKLISDHEMESIQLGMYAVASGSYLPASIQGGEIPTAMKVLSVFSSSTNTSKYDRNYLQTMVRSHTMDLTTSRNTIATTTNPVLNEFAMDDIPTDVMLRQGATLLLRNFVR